eukprot:scaffold1330_cov240-Pinguiococcus_pyrenoidosus.AAC.29
MKGDKQEEMKELLRGVELKEASAEPLYFVEAEEDAEALEEGGGSSYTNVRAEEAFQLAQELEDAVLLDVRQEEEFVHGHAAGAVNVPYGKVSATGFEARAGFAYDCLRLFAPEAPLFLSCQAGRRSEIAASQLSKAGFKNVYNVLGGYAAWALDEELPVEAALEGSEKTEEHRAEKRLRGSPVSKATTHLSQCPGGDPSPGEPSSTVSCRDSTAGVALGARTSQGLAQNTGDQLAAARNE